VVQSYWYINRGKKWLIGRL